MRREGFVIEEIIDRSNMEESFWTVLRGGERKRSRSGKFLIAHKDEIIDELIDKIRNGCFKVSRFFEKEVRQAGKIRRIQVFSLKDRIGVHAIMKVVDEHLRKRFIRTTAASIKGRGVHDLLNYVRDSIGNNAEGTEFCYTFDIKKFYESVDHGFMNYCVGRVFKDNTLIQILTGFVDVMQKGISIGLRSSQGLGNLLLSIFVDHILKDGERVKDYFRYCDDGRALNGCKKTLWNIRDIVHRQVEEIKLEVKHGERVFPINTGIDFLGYVIYPDYIRVRKRNKLNFARKIHKIKSRKRRKELIASFYGLVKHADCKNLFYKLTGIKMKSFKDLNVTYKPEDGKKRFPGTVVSIRELVNLTIIVKDFEMGIKTEQGEDRCIVSIEQGGEMKKFFTNSEEMKNILQQINERPDGFPFETTIKTESFGKGRTKYIFS